MFIVYDNISRTDLQNISNNRSDKKNLTNPSSNDISSFESFLTNNQRSRGSQGNQGNQNISTSNRNFSSQVISNNDKLIKASEAAEENIRKATTEAIAQRVIDQKNSMQISSSASAVKKATEAYEKIKF